MATFKSKISLRLKGIKNFWKDFKRIKRGVIGLAVICAFIIVACFGPYITPIDPLTPKITGYPAGPAPIASELAKPTFQKYLPGGWGLSENMKVISDHQFSSNKTMEKWISHTSTQLAEVTYTPDRGYENDGAIQVLYNSPAGAPPSGPTVVRLIYNFKYPYESAPGWGGFQVHISYNVKGNVTENSRVKIELFLRRIQGQLVNSTFVEGVNATTPGAIALSYPLVVSRVIAGDTPLVKDRNWNHTLGSDTVGIPVDLPDGTIIVIEHWSAPIKNYAYPRITYEDSALIYIYPLHVTPPLAFRTPRGWEHKWIWSTALWATDPTYTAKPHETVFPTAGNYAFEIKITFEDRVEGEKRISVSLDNLDILIYGQVYGLLGTDGQKGSPRDITSSLIYGARLSVFLGVTAALISVTLGLLVGLIAGYFGGIIDEALMRITDVLMCLPGLPLIMVLIAVLGRSIVTLLILLSFLGWMSFARNVRSMALSIRERAFVEAAKASGARGLYIVFEHIFPNVITLAYLSLALGVPSIVLSEAALSWLGLYDPKIVSWGRMLSEFTASGIASTAGFTEYWWWVILPGAMISLLTISFILLGYSLDEILNPRLRLRR